MGLIYAPRSSKKPPKKKPGWKKSADAHDEWLRSVQGQTLGLGRGPKPKTVSKVDLVQRGPVVTQDRLNRAPSLGSFGGTGTKPVPRPHIEYKDDPELLARELRARERRFNVAPAYNKGGDVFVTEEELMKQLAGNKRRS